MLDYVALFILIIAALILFYGIIIIHDIPYEIAERRNHPHADAIHVAGWISLLTLHILWPFLWIWATLYRQDRGWGFSHNLAKNAPLGTQTDEPENSQYSELVTRITQLEAELSNLKSISKNAPETHNSDEVTS